MDKTIWTARCEHCDNAFAAWPLPEKNGDIEDPDDWDIFNTCPVCDKHMLWAWGDPVTSHFKTGY